VAFVLGGEQLLIVFCRCRCHFLSLSLIVIKIIRKSETFRSRV
jgi:hypothetical protein